MADDGEYREHRYIAKDGTTRVLRVYYDGRPNEDRPLTALEQAAEPLDAFREPKKRGSVADEKLPDPLSTIAGTLSAVDRSRIAAGAREYADQHTRDAAIRLAQYCNRGETDALLLADAAQHMALASALHSLAGVLEDAND